MSSFFGFIGTLFDDFVDEAIFFGFFCCKEFIAFGIFFDDRFFLASVFGEDAVEEVFGFENFFGLDLDIGGLAVDSAVWLMDHDLGMWKAETLAFCASCEDDGAA